jgi:serine/threonine protein phosphatase PrpC
VPFGSPRGAGVARSRLLSCASGHFGLQGRRPTMEDQAVAVDDLPIAAAQSPTMGTSGEGGSGGATAASRGSDELLHVALYGVYDGHGGTRAAEYTRQRLHQAVAARIAAGKEIAGALYDAFQIVDAEFEQNFCQQPSSAASTPRTGSRGGYMTSSRPASRSTGVPGSGTGTGSGAGPSGLSVSASLASSLASAQTRSAQDTVSAGGFDMFGGGSAAEDDQSGCTAVVAVVAGEPGQGGTLTVGNAGDSRAVLSRGGIAIPMTVDHKTKRQDERARILSAGGLVIRDRVLGRLAITRAIGDVSLKRGAGDAPLVTSEPELYETELLAQDDLLVLGCDGLFDVMESQTVIDAARQLLAQGASPEETARALAQQAFDLGSADNISVVVVKLGAQQPTGGASSVGKSSAAVAQQSSLSTGQQPPATQANDQRTRSNSRSRTGSNQVTGSAGLMGGTSDAPQHRAWRLSGSDSGAAAATALLGAPTITASSGGEAFRLEPDLSSLTGGDEHNFIVPARRPVASDPLMRLTSSSAIAAAAAAAGDSALSRAQAQAQAAASNPFARLHHAHGGASSSSSSSSSSSRRSGSSSFASPMGEADSTAAATILAAGRRSESNGRVGVRDLLSGEMDVGAYQRQRRTVSGEASISGPGGSVTPAAAHTNHHFGAGPGGYPSIPQAPLSNPLPSHLAGNGSTGGTSRASSSLAHGGGLDLWHSAPMSIPSRAPPPLGTDPQGRRDVLDEHLVSTSSGGGNGSYLPSLGGSSATGRATLPGLGHHESHELGASRALGERGRAIVGLSSIDNAAITTTSTLPPTSGRRRGNSEGVGLGAGFGSQRSSNTNLAALPSDQPSASLGGIASSSGAAVVTGRRARVGGSGNGTPSSSVAISFPGLGQHSDGRVGGPPPLASGHAGGLAVPLAPTAPSAARPGSSSASTRPW